MNKEYIFDLLDDDTLGRTRLLTQEEEQNIFKIFAELPELREEIQTVMIRANVKLVSSIASKYYPVSDISSDDIYQLGLVGLSKAIDKFDYTRGTRFSTYATYWIKQKISKELEKRMHNLGQALNIIELKKKFYETEQILTEKYKRRISLNEVANAMGMKATELKIIFYQTEIDSLDKMEQEGKKINYINVNNISDKDKQIDLHNAIEKLNDQQKEVIKFRYGYHDGVYHSFSEVASMLNISKQRVAVIEKKALAIMRDYLE